MSCSVLFSDLRHKKSSSVELRKFNAAFPFTKESTEGRNVELNLLRNLKWKQFARPVTHKEYRTGISYGNGRGCGGVTFTASPSPLKKFTICRDFRLDSCAWRMGSCGHGVAYFSARNCIITIPAETFVLPSHKRLTRIFVNHTPSPYFCYTRNWKHVSSYYLRSAVTGAGNAYLPRDFIAITKLQAHGYVSAVVVHAEKRFADGRFANDHLRRRICDNVFLIRLRRESWHHSGRRRLSLSLILRLEEFLTDKVVIYILWNVQSTVQY
jgi:hypothetical protein